MSTTGDAEALFRAKQTMALREALKGNEKPGQPLGLDAERAKALLRRLNKPQTNR